MLQCTSKNAFLGQIIILYLMQSYGGRSEYSYLPNKRGDSNKRAGWHFPTNGQGGKNILIHKKACQGWKISQNEINGHVEGGIFFLK